MIAMQSPTTNASDSGVVTLQSVSDFLVSGGPIMVPIALCSIVALGFAIERYLRLTRAQVLPPALDDAIAAAQRGDVGSARAAAESTPSPGGRVLLAGLRRAGYPLHDVERAMQDQAQKELEKLRANVRPLSVVAAVAPLLGLFGTVVGIADAFHRVVQTGLGKPENLAAGIEVALVTTIAGLMVAIPAMLAAHLTAKVRRLVLAVDERLSPVVEAIAARGRAEDAA
jgi:biopolymer transport protein ExbB